MKKDLSRKDVSKESTWNAEAVYASWEAWDMDLKAATAELSALSAFEGRLSEGPAVLADWFELLRAQRPRVMRLFSYAGMARDVDANDTTARGKAGQAMGLYGRFSAATAFAEPEMLALGDRLLEWADAEPRLAPYRHYFDNLLRQRAHTRSAEVEQVLGMLSDAFGSVMATAHALTNTDLEFADATDSQGQVHHVGQATVAPTGIQSPDRERRRTAWHSYCDGYLSMQNTLASNYLTSVKMHVFDARVRGYGSVLESRLHPASVPVEVFHTLIDTFKANLPTWHRYWAVKRKALGVDAIRPFDIWAPIVQDQPEISYQQAVDWISEGLAPLGETYVNTLRRGCLEERWVDYAPNVGKMQGARSSPGYDTPPFIITSYDNTLMSLSVLAHELGHSMHGYLSRSQPEVYYYGVPMSMTVAETASNFNQALTRAYLMQARADDAALQIALIEEAMFNFHRYFFLMPTLARFELEVFARAEQDQPLTADILNGIMRNLFAEGYGDTMTDDGERTSITWAQFMHLYIPFYTFQYAIGISAAHALAQDVLAGTPGARERYLEFLNAGSSRYPMDLFKLAGVDMSTPKPVEKTFSVLADLVSRLEELTS
jgi:oligoendopeptidase F